MYVSAHCHSALYRGCTCLHTLSLCIISWMYVSAHCHSALYRGCTCLHTVTLHYIADVRVCTLSLCIISWMYVSAHSVTLHYIVDVRVCTLCHSALWHWPINARHLLLDTKRHLSPCNFGFVTTNSKDECRLPPSTLELSCKLILSLFK
jgi:hypothetical protein